jgi:hypothetical protein
VIGLAVLLALPAGYLMRSWLAANVLYAVVYLWAFVFQTLYLLIGFRDENGAFGATGFPWEYGVVTATVFGVGFALVAAGRRVRSRRGPGPAVA